jgi:hypothetical protein
MIYSCFIKQEKAKNIIKILTSYILVYFHTIILKNMDL